MDKIKYNQWNMWTQKSKGTKFKALKTDKGIGSGENKLAMEFDTKPKGQNSSYDLEINGEKWECKNLDSGNSFRLGVEVTKRYTEIKTILLNIFDIVDKIHTKLLNDEIKVQIDEIYDIIYKQTAANKKNIYDGLLKSEICESNFTKIDSVIKSLTELFDSNKKHLKRLIILHNPLTGKRKKYNVIDAYKILASAKISDDKIQEKIGADYNIIIISELSENLKYFKEKTVKQYFNEIVRDVFNDKILVLVDKKKGFMPINDLNKIVCCRITSGAPRCKYLI